MLDSKPSDRGAIPRALASFDMWKQNILLRLIETMNLIDKKRRDFVAGAEKLTRGLCRFANLGDIAFHA